MDATPAGLGPEASWLRSKWGIYCGHRRSTRTVRHELSTAGAIPPNVAAVYGTLCVVSKYDSLREHLDRLPPELVQLSFAEIDRIVAGLPPSAYEHRAWWSNERQGSHVQAIGWLDAGRRVESVDLNTTRVTFSARCS